MEDTDPIRGRHNVTLQLVVNRKKNKADFTSCLVHTVTEKMQQKEKNVIRVKLDHSDFVAKAS